jgi:predicted DNA-binding transcriptional regulator YafY
MQRVIERILNLLAFLLTTNRPVTADEIRNTVAGYEQESDAAFRRTFERDKDLLRKLGVPIRMTATDIWEVEEGYVVPQHEYAIRDPHLTEEERSALMAAAQAVQFGGQSTELSAIFKLGGASPLVNPPNVAADLGEGLDDLATLFDALAAKRTATFVYSGRMRTVHPYALAHRFGHWYLAAPESKDTNLVKAFRVDRMADVAVAGKPDGFAVPRGFDANSVIPSGQDASQEADTVATVRIVSEIASVAAAQIPGTTVGADDAGWTEMTIPVRNEHAFIGWLLGFDDRAIIDRPEELRAQLLAHISAQR